MTLIERIKSDRESGSQGVYIMKIDRSEEAEAQRRDAAEMGTARRFPPLSPADLDADYRTYKGPWAHPQRRRERWPAGGFVRIYALFVIVMTAAYGVALIAGGW